jgi:ParB family chromosome partitioning protein
MTKKRGMFVKSTQNIIDRKKVLSMSDFLDESIEDDNIYSIPIEIIKDNPNQPRKKFDEDKLKDLSISIKKHGIIQPIIVRSEDNDVILVAGERRLRAAKLAGLKNIPSILNKGNALEISLIENLQREDLDPFDEAEALRDMVEKYHYTQDKLAKVVGKSRSIISRSLSLNKIPSELRSKCAHAHIPKRSLVEIAKLETDELMNQMTNKIIANELKSDDVRDLVRKTKVKNEQSKPSDDVLACKKVEAFKRYLKSSLNDKINKSYSETLKEIKDIKVSIDAILNRLQY